MQYTYKINFEHPHWSRFTIDADYYSLDDGYFHFKERVSGLSSGRLVASVQAEQVFDVQRTDNEAADK